MNEEIIRHAQMLYQQSQDIEQRIEITEQNIHELQNFTLVLEGVKNESSEMLAPLGRGVFIKSQISDRKLFVDVGAGVLVRKSAEETKKILDEQLARLMEIRQQLKTGLGTMAAELENIVNSLETKT